MKNKRWYAMIMVVIVMMMGLTTLAASDVNADEQRVLDALGQSVTTKANVSLSLPAQYANQASNYLTKDGVDLTKDQCDKIIEKINAAITLIGQTDATKLKEIPKETVQSVVSLAQEAASIVGLTLSYDASTNAVTVKDKAGSTVVSSGKVVKQTGTSFLSTGVVFTILVAGAALCVVYAKKNNLIAKNR